MINSIFKKKNEEIKKGSSFTLQINKNIYLYTIKSNIKYISQE